MQGAQKKPKPKANGNGKVIPIKEKTERPGLRPEIAEFQRQKDVLARLNGLESLTGFAVVEAATYGVHPEIRLKAIGMLCEDRHALHFIVVHSPYKDAARAAEKLLLTGAGDETGWPETK